MCLAPGLTGYEYKEKPTANFSTLLATVLATKYGWAEEDFAGLTEGYLVDHQLLASPPLTQPTQDGDDDHLYGHIGPYAWLSDQLIAPVFVLTFACGGVCTLTESEEFWVVEFVATKPEFCRQGVNHLLMQAALSKGLTLFRACVVCMWCALTSLLVSRQAAGLHKGTDLGVQRQRGCDQGV